MPRIEHSGPREPAHGNGFENPPVRILLSGHSGNQSSKLADILAVRVGGLAGKFGDVVRSEAGEGLDRWEYMDLGAQMLSSDHRSFCSTVLEKNGTATVIVDGVRHVRVVEELQRRVRAPVFLVYLDALPEFRLGNLAGDGIDTPALLAKMDQHSTEVEVPEVRNKAALILDAARPQNELVEKIDAARQLLARIVVEPKNDRIRLEFANLLGEQNPWARFIKLQIERRQQRLRDPYGPEWARMLLNERKLEQKLDFLKDQLHFLGASDVKFHRGFPEEITIDAAGFQDSVNHLLRVAPVLHLTLAGARDHVREALKSPLPKQLVSLNLRRLGLEDDDLSGLFSGDRFAELRWLDVQGNRLGEQTLSKIARHLPKLLYLNFRGNRASSPVETYGVDALTGRVVGDSIHLTEDGRRLERESERLEWLHAPSRFSDYPPQLDDLPLDS